MNNYKAQVIIQKGEYPVSLIFHRGGLEANILRHWHPEIELNYTESGTYESFFIEENAYKLSQGDILFVNPFEIHGVSTKARNIPSESVLSIIIPPAFIDKYCPIMKNYHITARKINSQLVTDINIYSQLKDEFDTIAKLGKGHPNDFKNLKIIGSILNILSLYLENFSEKRTKDIDSYGTERIYKIISYLHESYNQNLNLDTVSEKIYLNKSYLARYFKKCTGLTIFQYINVIRGIHAIEMLRKTEKSVEIVAMECGFMDSKAMNKILKRNYGQTAKYFRSQYLP